MIHPATFVASMAAFIAITCVLVRLLGRAHQRNGELLLAVANHDRENIALRVQCADLRRIIDANKAYDMLVRTAFKDETTIMYAIEDRDAVMAIASKITYRDIPVCTMSREQLAQIVAECYCEFYRGKDDIPAHWPLKYTKPEQSLH